MAEPVTPPPPMDEILASIRRIIVEDPPLGGRPQPVQADAPVGDGAGDGVAVAGDEEAEDVLELGEAHAPGIVTASAASATAGATEPRRAFAMHTDEALVSSETQAASQRALAALSGLTIDPTAPDNTLDGLVRDMLRPMLRSWLDDNLPEMVERLVAREVARLTGR